MQNSNDIKAPTFDELLWPTIQALKELGGSATNQELVDKIIEIQKYSESIQSIMHTDGRMTRLEYNAAWARTYLKKADLVNNGSKGVWMLLDKGENVSEADLKTLPSKVRGLVGSNDTNSISNQSIRDEIDIEDAWQQNLSQILKSIKPDAFERLAQRILRESGFVKVEVTGKTNDGGIDGVGILKINLLSFHVSFQCKRYQGSVSPSEIRDFRGAMIGRSDKGIFITTGTFTSEARKEANRDGAPAIDLIDGKDLCELLKNLGLGISIEKVEKIKIDTDWFLSV
jgi:restriction system protein